jgi:hypothetical protein
VLPDETFLTRAVCTLFSAFAHVAIFASFVVVSHRAPVDIGATGHVAPHGAIEVGLVDAPSGRAGATAGAGAHASRAPAGQAPGHASTSGVTNAPMRALGASRPRVGDWVGTYECVGDVYAFAIHVERVHGNSFRVLGSATSPTGLHGIYAQHGVLDPATGDAKFLPDGWVGTPMPNHHIVGMHGRFDGDSFAGAIDDSECGAVSLHRQTS